MPVAFTTRKFQILELINESKIEVRQLDKEKRDRTQIQEQNKESGTLNPLSQLLHTLPCFGT